MSAASCLRSEDQFLCSICLDVFTDPVTTPCGHNFCKNCITELWNTSNQYMCPICKEVFDTRPKLRVNTLLSEMVSQFRQEAQQKASSSSSEQQAAKPGEVPCDVCTGTKLKALKSCLVCLTSYFETHLTVSRLKRHQLIEPVENLEDRMCMKHDKPLELFCKTDQTCVCMLCSVLDQKTHDVVPLKEEYEDLSTSNTTLTVSEDIKEDQLDPGDPERLKQKQPVYKENLTDTTHWQAFTPKVLIKSANISYRFQCPGPGMFRCTLTRLVFVMVQGAEVHYKHVQWNERVLQAVGKTSVGRLFNIQSPDGAVSQLHLPHCETMDAPLHEGLLSVVHITDDEMSILEPLKITDSHVVVNVSHLSAFGLVLDLIKNSTLPVGCQVLLFLRLSETSLQKLNVFLLQDNIPLDEVAIKQREAEYIESTSNCQLSIGQRYSVHCEPEAFKIQPEHVQFDTNCRPNFHPTFEVFLPTNQETVTLMVQNQQGIQVWKRFVCLNLKGLRRENLQGNLAAEERLRSVRRLFVQGITEPNLDRLLDKLLECGVINDDEMQLAETKTGAHKARHVIDMVRKKGTEASSFLIATLCEVDPNLSRQLAAQVTYCHL